MTTYERLATLILFASPLVVMILSMCAYVGKVMAIRLLFRHPEYDNNGIK